MPPTGGGTRRPETSEEKPRVRYATRLLVKQKVRILTTNRQTGRLPRETIGKTLNESGVMTAGLGLLLIYHRRSPAVYLADMHCLYARWVLSFLS